jgi:hypothetical protein
MEPSSFSSSVSQRELRELEAGFPQLIEPLTKRVTFYQHFTFSGAPFFKTNPIPSETKLNRSVSESVRVLNLLLPDI